MENVSWDMAQDFCKKLSERQGNGVVLPTEAEWEYACRAGTTTPFHFGSVLDGTQANCHGRAPYGTEKEGPCLERPTPVGSYAANGWGLYDVHGNVWEWCADGYNGDAYKSNDSADPFVRPNDECGYRVLRGGSWGSNAKYCRAAYRYLSDPADRDTSIGFRVALRLD